MGNNNVPLGKVSLWTSIIGIVLPGCLYVLVAVFFNREGWAYGVCELLFVILEFVALGCGIAARRTPTGRGGLVISGSLLSILLCIVSAVLLYFFFFFQDR